MPVRIDDTSRLNFSDLVTVDAEEFWDLNGAPPVEAQVDDMRYTVTDTDRMDRIATQFYGDPMLWWVIAKANGIEDPISDIYPGVTLTIPSPRYVKQEYFALKQV